MHLIDAYLTEVGQHLPREQRSDIVGELRDDIVEQLNALAEQTGRAPDAEDERAVLSRLGHPLKVASAYKSRRYLIGPTLYPAYLKTLRTSVCVVLAVSLLFWIAVGSDSTGTYVFKGLLGQAVNLSFWVVVIVTLSFLALEASGETLGWYHNWSPDQLKTGTSPIDYSDLVINVLTEGFFLLVWNSLLTLSWGADPQWLAGLNFAVIWSDVFWPLNVVVGGLLALHLVVLIQGTWQRWTACLELALCGVMLVILASLVLSGALVFGIDANSSEHAAWLDRTLQISLVVVALITLWDSKLAYGRWRKPELVS